MSLEPGRLAFDSSGAPFSERYRDVYASRDGAEAQAEHVFLHGNGLPARWRARRQFVILETGFGLGINFLSTWRRWLDDPQRPDRLHYVSLERHPLSASDLVGAASDRLRELAHRLALQWPLPLAGLHRLEFEGGRVILTLGMGDARALMPQLAVGADAIYLDGFAPDRNPEMWDASLLRAIARCARPAATLATWSTARAVRDGLADAGFAVSLAPGFGSKRQMTAARFAPRWQARRHPLPMPRTESRSAIVIGSGLAGCACADALARRGWTVSLIDRASGPASGASALPWGVLHPHFSADDNVLARITRAGLRQTVAALRRLAARSSDNGAELWRSSGVFETAANKEEENKWKQALLRLRWPAQWVEWLDAHEAAMRLGVRPRAGGLWWHEGALVSPFALCTALVNQPGIEFHGDTDVTQLTTDSNERWIARTSSGSIVGAADVAIVANALDAPRLLSSRALRLQQVRGRLAYFEDAALASLAAPISGKGVVYRSPDGRVAVGATYEMPLSGSAVDVPLTDERAAAANLARLGELVAETTTSRVVGQFDAVRAVAPDRLPCVGPIADEAALDARADMLRGAHLQDLPRRPGLYGCFGLASRGLSFAVLAGEVIASQLEGEPLPLERALLDAIDPARFALRRLRRGRWTEEPLPGRGSAPTCVHSIATERT